MSYSRWKSISVYRGHNGAGRFVLQQKVRVFCGGDDPEKVVPQSEHRSVSVKDLEDGGEINGRRVHNEADDGNDEIEDAGEAVRPV